MQKYKLNYKNMHKLKFFSIFYYKLFKKYLSSKLTIFYNKCIYLNILNTQTDLNLNTKKSKIFYNRRDIVPIRLLRYFLYLNISILKLCNVGFFITNKLSVFNGKRAKPINIFRELLNK